MYIKVRTIHIKLYNLGNNIRWMMTIVLICAISMLTACDYDYNPVKTEDGLNNRILSVMEEQNAIGAAVVVAKDTSIIYTNTFGYNPDFDHPELRKPIPADGVFWLASVTKTFISTAIMQLVEKGMIGLDDDVNNYLSFPIRNPSYPQIPITIRMLLSHRSSLTDKQGSRTFANLMTEDKTRYAENFDESRPGDKFVYCNLGYSILGAIIEEVIHERFDYYIEREILNPLNIEGSFDLTKIDSQLLVRSLYFDAVKKSFVKPASVYDYQKAKDVLIDYQLGVTTGHLVPAGGLKMSAANLARFMMVLMKDGELGGKRILRNESLEEMYKPQGEDRNYGLALTTYTNILINHSFIGIKGASHGIHSIMVYEPETKMGFIIINNGYDTTVMEGVDLNYRIIRLLYKYFVE